MKIIRCTKFCLVPCVALLAAQIAVLSASAADATDNPGQLSAEDYKFAKEAACGGMFEVNLGNMALANSQNAAVKQFGQRMVTDHGKANQELEAIASRKGATLPTQLPAHKQKEVDRLAKLSGPAFDKAYVALMVKAHKEDEKAFKKASEEAQDPDVKNFASTTLTMVQEHLKMAEDLQENIKHELSLND